MSPVSDLSSVPGGKLNMTGPITGGTRRHPPREIRTAVYLLITCAVVVLVAELIRYHLLTELLPIAAQHSVRLDRAVLISRNFSVMRIVIAVPILLLFAVTIRAGSALSRTRLTVIGTLSVIWNVVAIVRDMGKAAIPLVTLTIITSVVLVLLLMAAVVLVHQPAAKSYFTSRDDEPGRLR
jgi:hypothetical protein